MAISEDDRLALRTKLTEALGERETRVLMESIPPVDYDQLATKTDLAHQGELLAAETSQLRTDMNAEFKSVRAEIKFESASLRDEIAQLRLEMATGQRRMMVTHIGSMIGLAAFISVA